MCERRRRATTESHLDFGFLFYHCSPTKVLAETMMMCEEEWEDQHPHPNPDQDHDPFLNFDFLSTLSKPKDFYKILEVDYDATEDDIRSNYIRLALKWHPDKQKDQDNATSRFQEINEAYQVLSDPVRRREYDDNGMLYIYDHDLIEYLNRYKGLILTCNGLGMRHSIW